MKLIVVHGKKGFALMRTPQQKNHLGKTCKRQRFFKDFTCNVSVALELVPDDVERRHEEEDPADELNKVVNEQGILHALVVDGELALGLVRHVRHVNDPRDGLVPGDALADGLGAKGGPQSVGNLLKSEKVRIDGRVITRKNAQSSLPVRSGKGFLHHRMRARPRSGRPQQ